MFILVCLCLSLSISYLWMILGVYDLFFEFINLSNSWWLDSCRDNQRIPGLLLPFFKGPWLAAACMKDRLYKNRTAKWPASQLISRSFRWWRHSGNREIAFWDHSAMLTTMILRRPWVNWKVQFQALAVWAWKKVCAVADAGIVKWFNPACNIMQSAADAADLKHVFLRAAESEEHFYLGIGQCGSELQTLGPSFSSAVSECLWLSQIGDVCHVSYAVHNHTRTDGSSRRPAVGGRRVLESLCTSTALSQAARTGPAAEQTWIKSGIIIWPHSTFTWTLFFWCIYCRRYFNVFHMHTC